ncbi:hypothetical protein BOSE62_71569 [Bosea sp. 62]|uniref:transposase n=1 Tax=unclassified Bosea (in: a-proteobacteria) TaxID=2653178 RepID=UPI00125FACF2|nr:MULTISPECIES: transposase [unclassified Bosea (in: a-proteobacteria)]CAD5293529.1 hypothetical protein BOSE46_80156 [Bosea sp. 46]VXB08831.1 hypothetical protein BOSE125_120035 [Bosea sp. 125]VXC72024.1 hypothetical protein BOSE29B_80045 [Bosea sp. 29B]VXC93747.1 hypothetical protein BOSE62_71569 [Bosea sp. 62]
MLVAQPALINGQILEADRRIKTDAHATENGRRLMDAPGVGPLLANALVASIPDPQAFRSGRNLAAWIGLVPRQNSSGGKETMPADATAAVPQILLTTQGAIRPMPASL